MLCCHGTFYNVHSMRWCMQHSTRVTTPADISRIPPSLGSPPGVSSGSSEARSQQTQHFMAGLQQAHVVRWGDLTDADAHSNERCLQHAASRSTCVASSLTMRASICKGSWRRKWNSGQKVWAWKGVCKGGSATSSCSLAGNRERCTKE